LQSTSEFIVIQKPIFVSGKVDVGTKRAPRMDKTAPIAEFMTPLPHPVGSEQTKGPSSARKVSL
jgi:hypothetical protein